MPLRALAPLLMAVIVIALPARGADEKIWLELRAPEPDAIVTGPIGVLEVAGWAGTGSEDHHDLIIAIDVSKSTGSPSGADVNGNGKIGHTLRSARDPLRSPNPRRICSDPGDTVLAAEIAGASRLIERLDRERTRIGIVTFADRSRVVAPLGSSPEEIDAALRELASEAIPGGRTNIAAALRAATRALLDGTPIQGAQPHRSLILLSDGIPTSPGSLERAEQETLGAALEAAERGVRIHALALGTEVVERTDVFAQISSRSGGDFVALEKPADVMLCLSRIMLTRVAEVVLANNTTGDPGRATRLFPDGSFDGIVALVSGENRIAVVARGPGGARRVAERVVFFERREPRNEAEARVTREKLARLRRRTVETELALEIERSRDADRDKQLELLLTPGGG